MGVVLPFDPAIGIIAPGGPQTRNPKYFAVPDGLVAYWGFDPDNVLSSTLTEDLSGQAHTGTLVNGPTITDSEIGYALKFTAASSQYASFAPTVPGLNTAIPFSVSLWARPNSIAASGTVIGTAAAAYDWSIGADGAGHWGMGMRSTASDPSVGGAVQSGAGLWDHIVGQWDGAKIRLFVNGVVIGEAASARGRVGTSFGQVGAFNNAGYSDYFNGLIKGVRGYARAIDIQEVSALFQAGRAGRRDAGARLPGECEMPALRASFLYSQLERGIRGLHRGIAQGSYR